MSIKQRSGECTEDLFWEAVAELDWATRSRQPRGYEVIKKQILAAWDREFILGFRDLMRVELRDLDSAIEKWEDANDELPCGDDGYGDLKHHILGLGREVFEAEKADPALVLKRASEHDYVESFGYAIPYKSDLPKDISMEEARAKVRARHAEWGDLVRTDDEVEREALTVKHGAAALQMPEYYAAWARMEVTFVGQLLDSPFAEEVGMERIARLEGSLRRMGRGEMDGLDFDLLRRELEEIRDRCFAAHAREMERLEVLPRRGRGHSLEHLLSDAQEKLGPKKALDSASPSV